MTWRSASERGAVEAPLALERGEEPGEVAAGGLEGRPLDLDLEEADDRIDDEVADRDALPDDLPVDLALGRDVDEDVAVDRRRGSRGDDRPRARGAGRTRPRRRRPARGCAPDERIPCFGYSPSAGRTWQRPHSPRPPQTESRSTPRARAASRTVVPSANRPRRPDGVKMTSGSAPEVTTRRRRCHAAAPAPEAAPPAAASARRLTRRPRSPAAIAPSGPLPIPGSGRGGRLTRIQRAASAVVAHQDVGGHDGRPDLRRQRVRDRRGQPGRDRHRQEGRVDPLPVRQPEADVRGAAGRVDAELLAEPADEPEDLLAGGRASPRSA